MERCQYCDNCYHPMTRYTLGEKIITVCQIRFIYDDDGNYVETISSPICHDKAIADGFAQRYDLTPKR